MTTKNLSTTSEPEATPSGSKAASASPADTGVPTETITLSHHLAIGGTDYPPGSKVRVPTDYARRLRRQGYVARS
ncbi:hypothetical protein [Streptomyces sp. NPDC058657]|uniref:hypothetical protein n=1 Tax=unclassified Streptomyces TaxID=2593676 RepID=UPI00365DC485